MSEYKGESPMLDQLDRIFDLECMLEEVIDALDQELITSTIPGDEDVEDLFDRARQVLEGDGGDVEVDLED